MALTRADPSARTLAVNADKLTVRSVITTIDPDRAGDVVVPTGLRNADEFLLNPVRLWVITHTSIAAPPRGRILYTPKGIMNESHAGEVWINRTRAYALIARTDDGVRVRLSVDEWDMLGVAPGMRVELRHGDAPARPYFVRSATYAAPCWQWVELFPAPVASRMV